MACRVGLRVTGQATGISRSPGLTGTGAGPGDQTPLPEGTPPALLQQSDAVTSSRRRHVP